MNNKCGPSGCPKAGIKIHETPNSKPNPNTQSISKPNIMNKKSTITTPVKFHQT